MTPGTTFIRSHATRQAVAEPVLPDDVRWMHHTSNLLFVLAGVLLAAMAVLWWVRQPVFALRSIRIDGDMTRNSVATIRVNAVPKLRGNFFSTDLQADQRAFESVPWVRHAVVQRVWPDRLAVRLEEHRPAAVWIGSNRNDLLVNTLGEVFEANVGDVEDDKLPELQGPEGSSLAMLDMLVRLQTLFVRREWHIDALRLSSRLSWRVELDNAAVIELGRGSHDEVIARTQRFIATVSQLPQPYRRPIEYADLRHRDGYALRLQGVTTTPPPPPGTDNRH
jgi:cell division protein FtsQ